MERALRSQRVQTVKYGFRSGTVQNHDPKRLSECEHALYLMPSIAAVVFVLPIRTRLFFIHYRV